MASNLTDLYKEQISLTEWLAKIGNHQADAMRLEDNAKRDRLGILFEHIALPFDRPDRFPARDIASDAEHVLTFIGAQGDSSFNLRLVPTNPELPKLRTVDVTASQAAEWLKGQQVDLDQYEAHFVPRPKETVWSSIFAVTDQGIFGEFIPGLHHQLTQGFHDAGEPVVFYYDFREFTFQGRVTPELEAHIRDVVAKLYVPDEKTREILIQELDAEFAHDYLKGYFETIYSTDRGLWFIDYNRILHKSLEFNLPPIGEANIDEEALEQVLVQGATGSPGIARGRVRIAPAEVLADIEIGEDEILVCAMTSPHYLPLMAKCAGIVTDQGGMLSHAAIICRELGKPCVVGTKKATEVLVEGMEVVVDADSGRVYKI